VNEIKRKIIVILQEITNEQEIDESIELIDSGFLDSFDIITLIGKVESELNINIVGEDIVPENFNSITNIASLLERYSNG
jgi:D-alanine--poly(phosphoribitol) ligase subunit 2